MTLGFIDIFFLDPVCTNQYVLRSKIPSKKKMNLIPDVKQNLLAKNLFLTEFLKKVVCF